MNEKIENIRHSLSNEIKQINIDAESTSSKLLKLDKNIKIVET